jgi:hypothetical protein
MRIIFNENNAEQLRTKYRKLLQEAKRLSGVDPKLANTYHNEACKILNAINLFRRQNPSFL